MTPHDPHAVVELGGSRLDTWAEGHGVAGVEVELATGETSRAELRVFDPDPAYAFIESLTGPSGVRELPVTIRLGFGAGLGGPVFKGLLTGVEREHSTTVCRFSDASFRMHKAQKTEYHRDVTDLQIIERLARRNGLLFEGPDRPVRLDRHKSHKQEARTDWAEALQRAAEVGLVIFVRGDTLLAKEAAKTAAPSVTLTFREDFVLLDDFHLAYRTPDDQEGRPGKVEARGRGRAGRRLKGESERHARGAEQVELKRDLRIRSKRHADRRAEARKALQREHAFRGTVGVLNTFTGPRPDVRETAELRGLPSLFNGRYLLDRVSHVFRPGRLTMEFDVYRDIRV